MPINQESKFESKLGRAFVVLGAAAALGVLSVSAADAGTLRLFNGPPQGTWRPIAEQLKKLVETATGDNVVIEPGGGLSNVIALQMGKGELGMVVSAPLVSGLQGKPPFREKLTNVQALATLYYQPAYIMTFDPKITKVTDLKGKRVSVMPKGYAAEALNQLLLKTVGLAYGDIREQFLGELESADALRDNHIDAIMAMGDTKYSIAVDLASTGRLRFVSLEKETVAALQKINEGLYPHTVKVGAYPGMSADFTTYAATVLVAARSDLPDAKAGAIVKRILDALPEMQRSFNSFKDVTRADMVREMGIPFHAGALAYFREAALPR
ncbi:MAG: TAXI family TRAP transporter solute-binding subunit [Hyphomicrobiales bacterium]|nr:TAXI family TRAP transporter solute-binding subunit [Hyphomicrobiales bacterium]